MNKYQEALNKLRFAVSIAQDLPYKECNELCDILQELINKETPMKPIDCKKEKITNFCDFGFPSIDVHFSGTCSRCNKYISKNSELLYCYNCGQKLDWSDDYE